MILVYNRLIRGEYRVVTYIIYIFLTILGLVLMKLGGGDINFSIENSIIRINLGTKIILAFLVCGVSYILWSRIVYKNDLGYIVPMTSAITNIITMIIGILMFNENFNIYKIIGIVLATVGIILINVK